MDELTIKFVLTMAVTTSAVVGRIIMTFVLNKVTKTYGFRLARKKKISRIVNIGIYMMSGLFIVGIWELDESDLALYFASVLTVVGVAFFAQWSHLSNITASVILFLGHPVKVGDRIVIMDGESQIQGEILDIGIMFVTMKTPEYKTVTISTTLFLQKIVAVEKSSLHSVLNPAKEDRKSCPRCCREDVIGETPDIAFSSGSL